MAATTTSTMTTRRQRVLFDKTSLPKRERWSLFEEPGGRLAPLRLGRLRLRGQGGDGAPQDLDLGVVRDLENDEGPVLVEGGDAAEDACAGDDLVALLERREQLLLFLLPLAHGH